MVYLMVAEHYAVPGIVMRVCATRERALTEALDCVNIMLKDKGRMPARDESAMLLELDRLQDEHGAAHCYAEISQHEVL